MKTRTIKPARPLDMPMVSNAKSYPRLTISYKDLPEAKDWKVGETYELEVSVKLVGQRMDEYSNEASFEIHSVAVDNDDDEADEK